LDFDGTLVEIAPTPASVRAAPCLAGPLLNVWSAAWAAPWRS
jgi:trehalose-6-phosphatase